MLKVVWIKLWLFQLAPPLVNVLYFDLTCFVFENKFAHTGAGRAEYCNSKITFFRQHGVKCLISLKRLFDVSPITTSWSSVSEVSNSRLNEQSKHLELTRSKTLDLRSCVHQHGLFDSVVNPRRAFDRRGAPPLLYYYYYCTRRRIYLKLRLLGYPLW